MSEFIDYYEALQVHPMADAEVIDKAYRVLIGKHHPDRGGDTKTAQLINEAYETLKDPKQRATYNLLYGSAQQHSRSGREVAQPDGDAVFASVGYPEDPSVRRAFNAAWRTYQQWIDDGASDDEFEWAAAGLMRAVTDAIGVDWAFDAVIRASFPSAAGAEPLERAILSMVFSDLPDSRSLRFPEFLDRCYRMWVSGDMWQHPNGGLTDARVFFVDMLGLFLRYVSRFHPELQQVYLERLASTYPRTPRAGMHAIALIELAAQPYDASDWDQWDAQSEKATPSSPTYPAMDQLGREAVHVAGRGVQAGCSGIVVAGVVGVVGFGIAVLAAAGSADSGGAPCLAVLVLIGTVVLALAAFSGNAKKSWNQTASGNHANPMSSEPDYLAETSDSDAADMFYQSSGHASARSFDETDIAVSLKHRYGDWLRTKTDADAADFMELLYEQAPHWPWGEQPAAVLARVFPQALGVVEFAAALEHIRTFGSAQVTEAEDEVVPEEGAEEASAPQDDEPFDVHRSYRVQVRRIGKWGLPAGTFSTSSYQAREEAIQAAQELEPECQPPYEIRVVDNLTGHVESRRVVKPAES